MSQMPANETMHRTAIRYTPLLPISFSASAKPAVMGKVPCIVHHAIATQLIRKVDCTKTTVQTGTVVRFT